MSNLKFRPKHDPFRRGPMTIDTLVETEINDAGTSTERGELEALRAELDMTKKILGMVARSMSDMDQYNLAMLLGGYERG